MFLDSNKKLVAVLTAAKTTLNLPVTVDYVDLTSTTTSIGQFPSYTNGTTAVDILAAPTAPAIRKINGLTIYGRDTAAKTVRIYTVDSTPTTGLITAGAFVVGNDYQIVSVGTTDFTLIGASANTIGVIFTATGVGTGTGTAATAYQIIDMTLQIDDTLNYTDTNGLKVIDVSGQTKMSMPNYLPLVGGTLTGDLSLSTNLNFLGTSNRITGDFSNATEASRVAFQSSTINGVTVIPLYPNGTGTRVGFSSPGAIPFDIDVNGGNKARIDSSGNVTLGGTTTAPVLKLNVAASQVDYITITGSSTGNPAITATGASANINFYLAAKGSGQYIQDTDGGFLFRSLTGAANSVRIQTSSAYTNYLSLAGSATNPVINVSGGSLSIVPATIFSSTIRLAGYTVATLPAGTQGDTAYVTDATAPTYKGALTGGGAVVTRVFKNATAWESS